MPIGAVFEGEKLPERGVHYPALPVPKLGKSRAILLLLL